MKKYIVIVLILYTYVIYAQQGPDVPCVECELLTARTEPATGMWFNPEQSGTGFNIEVQNGNLLGTYYGYDEDGKQIWLLFSGALVASVEPNIMWTIDTHLTQYENGNSFNNTHVGPNTTDYDGQISIKFTQKNHATFSVNGGNEQNIIPLIYGVSANADFPELTSYQLPTLKGMWTFVIKVNHNEYPQNRGRYSYKSIVLSISDKSPKFDRLNDGNLEILYLVDLWQSVPEIYPAGDITCETGKVNGETVAPTCTFRYIIGFNGGYEDPINFKFSLGGLGAFRLFGESEEGHTFEAFKVDKYDIQ